MKKMVELGKFEYINSNWPNQKGIVVTDRKKINVKTYNPGAKEVSLRTTKAIINTGFWYKLKNLFN